MQHHRYVMSILDGGFLETPEGARSFLTSGDAYDRFMGRYSRPLAEVFADSVGVSRQATALDVGCGPGALTGVLVDRLGTDGVFACDPSAPFVDACIARNPGVDVRLGRAEALPFEDGRFDISLAQLVLHFVTDANEAASELRRVVRPGGIVAACMWDFETGMEMLRHFWDAALAIDPNAPDGARTLRFGRQGEIVALFDSVGLEGIVETTLHVSTQYDSFDELWNGFLAGIGPAGVFCVALSDDERSALREELFRRVGSPTGPFALAAMARSAHGRVPA